MEEEMLCVYLILKKRQNEERNDPRIILSRLRDSEDPLLLEEDVFKKFLRFPKTLCWDIIQELKLYDESIRQSRIPFEIRFIAALYFLSNGSYQSCVGNSHFVAMSQSSVSRSIAAICKLVVERKHYEIKCPSTFEQYNGIKRGFHNKFGIKGVIGAIDCTHVAIVAPPSTTPGVVQHEY